MRNAWGRPARAAWAFAAAIAVSSAAGAATITQGDVPGGTGGITYAWQIELGSAVDSAGVTGNVGSKSWADPSNPGLGSFGLNAGWTHTSNWVYLHLAQPALVTLTLSPNGNVTNPSTGGLYGGDLVPAMSVWSGIDNDGSDDHFFEQGAVPHWVDAPGFAFLDHDTMGAGPFAGASATVTIALGAGSYTINIGGHDDVSAAHRAGYTFSVNAVPEPGTMVLAALGLGALALRRKRS